MKTLPLKWIAAVILLSFTTPAFSGEAKWFTDYAKAAALAKAQNKAILLDFTGSDWCGWCMKMKKETFDKPAFKQYAEKNLVLMEVDFPNSKPQTNTVKKQNQELKEKYKAKGYPTLVLIDADGKELGRQGGYLEGGPDAFIARLGKFYTPAPVEGTPATTTPTKAGSSEFDKFFKKPAQTPAP